MKKIVYLAPLALLGMGARTSANQVSTHISNALRVYEEQQAKQSNQSIQNKQTNSTSLTNHLIGKNREKFTSFSPTGQSVDQPVGKTGQAIHISRLDEGIIDDMSGSTQSLNMQINSKQVLSPSVIKSNLSETKIDPLDSSDDAMIARGYHKTAAGWTKLSQGHGYDAVATSTQAKLIGSNGDIEENSNNFTDYLYTKNVEFSTVIGKDNSNKKNLILSIPVLTNDSTIDPGIYMDARSDMGIYSQDHTKVGTLQYDYHSDELDFFYVPENNTKVADLKFKMTLVGGIARNGQGAGELKNHPKSNPYIQKLVLNDDSTYQNNLYLAKENLTWADKVPEYIHYDLSNDNNFHCVDIWANTMDSSKPWYPMVQHHVLYLSSPTASFSLNGTYFTNDHHMHLVNSQGQQSNQVIDINSGSNFIGDHIIKLADNLTPDEVYAKTPLHDASWSLQSDGSILIGTNFDGSEYSNATPEDITASFKASPFYYSLPRDQANSILQSTINYYKNRGYHLLSNSYCIGVNSDFTKPFVSTLSDVTPNADYTLPTPKTTAYSPSQTSIDVSLYRTLNIKFVDDQGKVCGTYTKTTTTGTDLTLQLGRDYQIPNNVILKADQPQLAKYSYNSSTGLIHYGLIHDSNPDIIFKVDHKFTTASPDSPSSYISGAQTKALVDSVSRTLHFINGNDLTPDQINQLHLVKQNNKYINKQSVDFGRTIKIDQTTMKTVGNYSKWQLIPNTANDAKVINNEAYFNNRDLASILSDNSYQTIHNSLTYLSL